MARLDAAPGQGELECIVWTETIVDMEDQEISHHEPRERAKRARRIAPRNCA